MTSMNIASITSCTEFQISRPRRKARRSCLYCQKAHKTCGNERPCGQCVKRKMPSECVDGARKPPKYLDDGTSKVTKFEFHRDVISLQRSGNHKKDIQNFTVHGNKIIEPQASNERQIQDHKEDPFEKVFNEVIDSNFFYTEISSYDFGDQASERIVLKGNDSFIPFSNTEHSAWTEIASNESEDSEIGTPFKPHEHARDETCSGFAISSGWSSTFFPHGIEGEPFNCARKEPQSPSFWYAHE